jgi:thiamine monophosphate kinase
LPPGPQKLWVTGCLGDANLAVLTGGATPCFELRLEAARAVRERAGACIDTSGGLADALWMLHSVSPDACLEVDGAAIPLAPGVAESARRGALPPEAGLLGGAGEYELLFATPAAVAPEVLRALAAASATAIGRVVADGVPGLWWRRRDGRMVQLTEPPPCPRAAGDIGAHVAEVASLARRWFGP